jgi:hypothetical protein
MSGEGICWSNFLASTTRRIILEAGVDSFAKELNENELNGRTLLIITIAKGEKRSFVRCEAVEMLNWISPSLMNYEVKKTFIPSFNLVVDKMLKHERRSLKEGINYPFV